MKRIIYFIFLFILLGQNIACQKTYSHDSLLHAINNKNSEQVIKIIDSGVELNSNSSTSELHLALKNRLDNVALALIKNGADVNLIDSLGNSPVHLAAKNCLNEALEALIEKEANLNIINNEGYTPLNYAIISGNQKQIKQLLIHGAVTYQSGLSSMTDGPFVEYSKDGLLAYYLQHDSLTSATSMKSKLFSNRTRQFKGWAGDNQTYNIVDVEKPKWHVRTKQPIFVLGDIHGQYERMVDNLKDNKIIDSDLKWDFGKGHLVFVGDIFDRGPKVTEALWFIYHLEQQAEKAGGKVHLILGNHELLVLENDLRYINRKCEKLSENTGLNYALLFNPNSILGEWIRSKTTFLKINNILFVHAGVSEKLISELPSLERINRLTSSYLYGGENPHNENELDLIMGSFGPFWYRGFFKARSKYPLIKENELDFIMNKLAVNTIIVGHTENDYIKGYFNGKVINVNIPLADSHIPNQALIIVNDNFFHLSSKDKPRKIK